MAQTGTIDMFDIYSMMESGGKTLKTLPPPNCVGAVTDLRLIDGHQDTGTQVGP